MGVEPSTWLSGARWFGWLYQRHPGTLIIAMPGHEHMVVRMMVVEEVVLVGKEGGGGIASAFGLGRNLRHCWLSVDVDKKNGYLAVV